MREKQQLCLLQLRAQELEQQNSSLRQKCKALEHLLAHQDLMAGMQEQICIQEHTLAAKDPAGSCNRSVDITVTQQLLQDQWDHNPLLQCFHRTADPTAYIKIRKSSPQDIAQSWLLLLSSLSLALHCHDMHPEQVHSSSMLCRAVTDCNRFIAAVNLLQEEIWPQMWHLNLLTGVHETPALGHWQAAVAAAAPTASQLQEARDVLAITSSKLKPKAEAVGRQLQQVSRLYEGQQHEGTSPEPQQQQQQQGHCCMGPPAAEQKPHNACQQQQQQAAGCLTVHTPKSADGTAAATAAAAAAASWEDMQAEDGILRLEHSSSLCSGFSAAAAAAPSHGSVAAQCPASFALAKAVSVPRPSASTDSAAITAAAAAAAAAAGFGRAAALKPQKAHPPLAGRKAATAGGSTSTSSSKDNVPLHFLQVLSSLDSREAALEALSSSMTSWRVARMMVGALTFLLRADQLARLYLHSMPYMPIGCLLYDQIFPDDVDSHGSDSS